MRRRSNRSSRSNRDTPNRREPDSERNGAVRAAAVAALGRAGHLEPAEAALSDRNPIVREVAQVALRRQGVDLADRYRSIVRMGPVEPGVLAGLGETGDTADADLIRPSLADTRPRARVEAVRALRRLGTDPAALIDLLVDPFPAVTRQVATSLLPIAGELEEQTLALLLSPSQPPPHVRTAAYRLQRARSVWARVLTDLQLYDDANDDLRNRARGDLAGWLERDAATTYSQPNGQMRDALDTTLHELTASLGSRRERLLRFHLRLPEGVDGPLKSD